MRDFGVNVDYDVVVSVVVVVIYGGYGVATTVAAVAVGGVAANVFVIINGDGGRWEREHCWVLRGHCPAPIISIIPKNKQGQQVSLLSRNKAIKLPVSSQLFLLFFLPTV